MENVECSRAFVHGRDWTSWVDYCKGRGATDDMFVAAFSKVARRTMGAEEETDDAYKCMKAMNVINEFNVAVFNLEKAVAVTRTPRAEPISHAETRRRGEFESHAGCFMKISLHPIGEGHPF